MIEETRAARVRRVAREPVGLEPDPPRNGEQERHDRRRLRAAATTRIAHGRDERGRQHARREQEPLALREHRTGEQDRRGDELPRLAVEQPQRDRRTAAPKSSSRSRSACGCSARPITCGATSAEQKRRPEQQRRHAPGEQPERPRLRSPRTGTRTEGAASPRPALPMNRNADASRAGTSGGYDGPGSVVKKCRSRPWKK